MINLDSRKKKGVWDYIKIKINESFIYDYLNKFRHSWTQIKVNWNLIFNYKNDLIRVNWSVFLYYLFSDALMTAYPFFFLLHLYRISCFVCFFLKTKLFFSLYNAFFQLRTRIKTNARSFVLFCFLYE